MPRFLIWLLLSGAAFAGDRAEVIRITFSNGWGEERMILLTGFGPFGYITDNPSGRIAPLLKTYIDENCPVGEGVVEAKKLAVVPGIIDRIPTETFETVISLGVDAGTQSIRLETAAQNRYDNPETGRAEKIDDAMRLGEVIYGPAYPTGIPREIQGFAVEKGGDFSAGTFVCNDTYFRLCRKEKAAGYFVHIPNVARTEDRRLSRALGEIACRVFRN